MRIFVKFTKEEFVKRSCPGLGGSEATDKTVLFIAKGFIIE